MSLYKQLLAALIAMVLVIVIGTAGFVPLEGISIFDSLWLTMITVLTVGYGDTIPHTTGGKVFALLIIPLGIGIVTYAIGAVSALIIEGTIFQSMGRRKMEKSIAKLDRHIIVCGCGRVGMQVIQELKQKRTPFIVIDKDIDVLKGQNVLYIEGDATEDRILHASGIMQAAGLVAALPDDAHNVFVTLTARGLNPDIQIVARVERTESEEKLRRAGADKVINPSSIAGRRIAMDIIKPLSVNYVDTILYSAEEEFGIEEIRIGEKSSLAGKTLQNSNIRSRFDVTVLSVLRNGSAIHNPAGDEILQEHDMIIVFGPAEKLKLLEKES